MKTLPAAIGLWLSAILSTSITTVIAQSSTPPIWEGVYTAEQAERGRATFMTTCIRCHGGDLRGTTAPPLTGERFMATWAGESLEKLFVKIRDTMPPNFGSTIDDATKLDVVTFILQTGGYPAGPRALVAQELGPIQILRKGEQVSVQNFSLVQTVGCLARGSGDTWLLIRTAAPSVTREDVPAPAAIAAAAARPLGTETFLLLSVTPFKPDVHVGEKMEARGLVYRDGEDARLTLTSLQSVGSCQ